MPLKDEITYRKLNEEMEYYEVEIWHKGDCHSKFFRTITGAKKYFKKHAKGMYDCIKAHIFDEFEGPCVYVVYENCIDY